MKIVALNRDPGITPERKKGAAIHVAAMREAFRRLGHEVIAIDEHRDDYVLASLERLVESSPVDLVYERYSLSNSACATWLQRRSIPHVLEVNAPLEDEVSRYREVLAKTEWRQHDSVVFGCAAQVIAVSPDTASYAIDRGARSERTLVLPNGIDERIFHPQNRPPANRRKFLGKRFPEAVVLGFHGRLRPWHNFEAFVDLASALRKRGLAIHVITVGQGEFEEILSARLPGDAYAVFPWVNHSELGALVRCFDVLPLTYSPDAPCYFSPLKLNEAMACGVVPIVPHLGNLADVVTDGFDGLVFDPDLGRGGLEQAAANLVADSSERSRLSVNAALTGSQNTWIGVAETVLAGLERRL